MLIIFYEKFTIGRGFRTAATSKMEHFVIIVNGWKPLTIIPKSSILDVAAVLDPLQTIIHTKINSSMKSESLSRISQVNIINT